MTTLSATAAAAALEGRVLMAGDLNGRVAGTSDQSDLLSVNNIPKDRAFTDLVLNGHGRAVLRLCRDAGMILCTGRVPRRGRR